MKFIDKIYYINLKNKTERNEHCLKQFELHNIPNNKITRFEQYSKVESMIDDFLSSFDKPVNESDNDDGISTYKKIEKKAFEMLILHRLSQIILLLVWLHNPFPNRTIFS